MTDGHDPRLASHDLRLLVSPVRPPCLAMQGPGFGQDWHCIHVPDPPQHGVATPCLQWIFQVSREVIADHNDIFNSKARSLTLALA